jgi:alkylhydroperoxidase family enzyme
MPDESGVQERTARLKIPVVDTDTDDPIVRPIFRAMQERGAGPLHIHRVIAQAPVIYQGFSRFAAALRAPGATSRADRELAILRTAQLKASEYEFIQHRRIGLRVGLSQRQIDSLSGWRDSDVYDTRQRLILELTDGMVMDGGLNAATTARAAQLFSAQELVELVMVSAFYVAVAQFTHAVHIEPETGTTTCGED